MFRSNKIITNENPSAACSDGRQC